MKNTRWQVSFLILHYYDSIHDGKNSLKMFIWTHCFLGHCPSWMVVWVLGLWWSRILLWLQQRVSFIISKWTGTRGKLYSKGVEEDLSPMDIISVIPLESPLFLFHSNATALLVSLEINPVSTRFVNSWSDYMAKPSQTNQLDNSQI